MIPTNISRPQDIAIIFGIFVIVMVTFGFGIASINNNQNLNIDRSYYTNVYTNATSANGLKGTADSVSGGLIGQEGASTDTTEEGILVKGFNSLLSLGKVFKTTADQMNTGTGLLGIDPIYWIIYSSILLISFGVVMYTWIRGR